MNIPEQYRGRYFYHFTHIDNMASIIKSGGLLSTNLKNQQAIEHHNIANMDIQDRRSRMAVPCGPGGVVHDYVPFYFSSISPMLLGLLYRKVVDQPYICFVAVSIEKLLEENVVFTDASANTDIPPRFYTNPSDLDKLNWDLIDSRKWGQNGDGEKHARMAEVLVHQMVPLDWIDSYIVFNDIAKRAIQDCYRAAGLPQPAIAVYWFNRRTFYFTKHFFSGRENETLVTGPIQLYEGYRDLIDFVIQSRREAPPAAPRFQNVAQALAGLAVDFCAIPELGDIYQLETDNLVHTETVSDHTVRVVQNVESSAFFARLGVDEKNAVRLAAYLHDIGKGPREKWANGIQATYSDHPADAIPMLERILTEDFAQLSEEEIRWISLLVVYHDLMGDILHEGRNKEELVTLNLDEKELHMLAALTEADVRAINGRWWWGIENRLAALINETLGRC